MIPALAVFAICFALDWVWVWYTRAIAASRRLEATVWAFVIMLITGINIVQIGRTPLLVLVAAAGAALGTYTAMSREDDHE